MRWLGLVLGLLFWALPATARAAVALSWDWEMPVQSSNGRSEIELYAVLRNAPSAQNELVFDLQGFGYCPGTLVNNGQETAANPYTLDTDGLSQRLSGFSTDPLQPGRSRRFLFGVIRPVGGAAAVGSYSMACASLQFSSALFIRAGSNLTIQVTPRAQVAPVQVGFSLPLLLVAIGVGHLCRRRRASASQASRT